MLRLVFVAIRARHHVALTVTRKTSDSESGGLAFAWLQWYIRFNGVITSTQSPALSVHFSSTSTSPRLRLYTFYMPNFPSGAK
jgi:hypothetical protein